MLYDNQDARFSLLLSDAPMLHSSIQTLRCRLGLSSGITWCLILGLVVAGFSGCSGEKARKAGGPRAAGSKLDPDELTGRWKMTMANRGAQTDVGLIELRYDEKLPEIKYSIHLIGLGEAANVVKAKLLKLDEEGHLEFEIQQPNLVSNFSGRLDGEAIWGSYLVPHFQLVPAKLERTELEKLEPAPPAPVSHFDDYMKAVSSNDSYVALDTFADRANRSPLLFEAFEAMAFHLKKEKLGKPEIEEFIEKYRKAVEVWGPRLGFLVDLNVGHALAANHLEPELTKKLLEQAEARIGDDLPVEISAKIVEAWVMFDDPERALKRLPQLREKDPTNPGLLWLYARAKEKAKDLDEAMLAYTKVAVLPGFEQQQKTPGTDLPSLSAIRLWKAKNKDSTKGFEEYAFKAYEEVMKSFVPTRTPGKVEANTKIPLIELFTSTGCAPCIASDVAVESLRQAYSGQELVVIKFHQHAPYIDPLANDSSIKRLNFYGLNETPAMAFNGQPVEQSLGMASTTGSVPMIGSLRYSIDEDLAKTSPVTIKLEAKREGQDIQIKADVEGVKSLEHHPHLYLVLVENDIRYPGPNGMIMHSCVARAFAGGVKGIPLARGNSSHSEKISLTSLKEDLLKHIKQFETEREFPLKPLDFKKLQVVAFVQATHTRVVVQSALANVVGEIPPDPVPAVKPEATTEAKPEAKPESKPEPAAAPETKPEPKPEAKPDASPEVKPAVKPEAKPEPKAEEKPESPEKVESTPEAKSEDTTKP